MADRVVRPTTRANPVRLAELFALWLSAERGHDLQCLLNLPLDRSEQVAEALVVLMVRALKGLDRTSQPYCKY